MGAPVCIKSLIEKCLNSAPKSLEILMFVCLQKDAKQCCDATKLDCTHCTGQFTPKMKANAIPRLLSCLV